MYFSIVGLFDAPLPSPSDVVNAAVGTGKGLTVLDLSATDMMQPKSLEWLEQLSALCDAAGIRLRVVAPKGSKLRRALELLRFDRFLIVQDSVRAAVRFVPAA